MKLAAAHRYYESRRRRYNDSLPERQEQVKKVKYHGSYMDIWDFCLYTYIQR